MLIFSCIFVDLIFFFFFFLFFYMNSNVGRLITILLKPLTYLVNFCYLRYDIELVRLLALCTMGKNVHTEIKCHSLIWPVAHRPLTIENTQTPPWNITLLQVPSPSTLLSSDQFKIKFILRSEYGRPDSTAHFCPVTANRLPALSMRLAQCISTPQCRKLHPHLVGYGS